GPTRTKTEARRRAVRPSRASPEGGSAKTILPSSSPCRQKQVAAEPILVSPAVQVRRRLAHSRGNGARAARAEQPFLETSVRSCIHAFEVRQTQDLTLNPLRSATFRRGATASCQDEGEGGVRSARLDGRDVLPESERGHGCSGCRQ